MVNFSKKLRMLRKSKGYSQQLLANKLSVTKSLISSYEQELRMPSLDMLVKLSYEFGVSTDYLLGLDQRKTVNVEKLTDYQIGVVSDIVNEFVRCNDHTTDPIPGSQKPPPQSPQDRR